MTEPSPQPPGVLAVNGIVITRAVAEDLVGVIDALALHCAPKVLSGRIAAHRNQLIACCTSVAESAKPSEPEDVLSFVPGAAIDSTAAAQRLGTSEVWVRRLCREGQLVAKQIGKRWWIDPDSLDHYAMQKTTTGEDQ
jgi:Helix-turn-helix domain